MSILGRRLSPEASRNAALTAARALLIEAGPQAVTLKAVAGRIGRTHAPISPKSSAAKSQKPLRAAGLAKAARVRLLTLPLMPLIDTAPVL
jgi:hypothetical protein